MTLRVGIIGAGQAGERHAIGFSTIRDVTVAGIADIRPDRVASLAGRLGAQPYEDWRHMLDAGLEILVIALPHSLHVEPAEAAAGCGVHVLMEKPIATSLVDAQRIIHVCREAGTQLTISFVHRFRDELQVAKSWIQDYHIGEPRLASETMNGQRSTTSPRWLTNKEMAGGGVLMYGAIHCIDRLRWLFESEIVAVAAHKQHLQPHLEVEEGVTALLTFANGATATLAACAPSFRAQPAYWDTQIYGTHGMIRVRTRHWAELSNNMGGIRKVSESAATAGEHYNFARQAQAFVDAILAGNEPIISGDDGLKALQVVIAIYDSAHRGEVVHI